MNILSTWPTFFNSNYTFGEILSLLNFIICALLLLMYMHHNVFTLLFLFVKAKKFPDTKVQHKYAYLVCARNEEKVIGNLIDSIKAQDYPTELMKIYIIADNCTDDTAKVAREHGAVAIERFNKELIGKSYALDELFKYVLKLDDKVEAYFVFDADNLLTKDYTTEMNKAYDSGAKLLTSYRNSKNYGSNWIASGAGLLFLRECRLMHHTRSALNLSTYVSGTGFLVDKTIVEKNGGWPYHRLIEDIEFSIDELTRGQKTEYVETAEFYDEHPRRIKASVDQRMRWCKGTHQCFSGYETKLLKAFVKRHDFSCYDLATHIFPAPVISFVWINFLAITYGIYAICKGIPWNFYYVAGLKPMIDIIWITSVYAIAIGLLVTIADWKRIRAPWYKKILYCFTFPIYMLMYVPISTIALFKKVKWNHISHTDDISIEDMNEK